MFNLAIPRAEDWTLSRQKCVGGLTVVVFWNKQDTRLQVEIDTHSLVPRSAGLAEMVPLLDCVIAGRGTDCSGFDRVKQRLKV